MIERLTITQLVENTAGGPGLLAEHGLAFLLEADGSHLLFDTGQGMVLKHNAERLGLSLGSVEAIVLSHGHYDHVGGLLEALEMTGMADLYLHPLALAERFNREGRAIGAGAIDLARLAIMVRKTVETKTATEIFPGLHVSGEIPRVHAIEDSGGPFYRDAACSQVDNLPDDQAIYVETPEGLVVLLGCGHAGVINTLEYIQQLSGNKPIHAVLGGMHLLRASAERLAFTVERLSAMGIGYLAPNHCTGGEAICYFRNRFGGVFHESRVGERHSFGARPE